VAGVRGKAAGRLDGFGAYVRDLLRGAPALNVDETPARAAGGPAWVHVACTRYLTLLHTGDRSADSIDAGGVLPGHQGIIVRDGYGGYAHLTEAAHAWCGAHLLRDLRDVYDFEPHQQRWAHAMADLLCEARDAAVAARAAQQTPACPAGAGRPGGPLPRPGSPGAARQPASTDPHRRRRAPAGPPLRRL
jgi:transposase